MLSPYIKHPRLSRQDFPQNRDHLYNEAVFNMNRGWDKYQ